MEFRHERMSGKERKRDKENIKRERSKNKVFLGGTFAAKICASDFANTLCHPGGDPH